MSTKYNLALQGGGAHGAFTWGVLHRLLLESSLEIASISGTSAGALNGAAVKSGLAKGSREAAIEQLDLLWSDVGAITDDRFSGWINAMMPTMQNVTKSLDHSPGYMWFDMASRAFSPYAYGPFYRNPLDPIVSKFHFDDVCAEKGPQLHICATNVRSGKIRVFTGAEITADVIMASACLPTMYQAVELDDPKTGRTEAYWDGGYTGNPALFPLFDSELPDDIVIVNINPLYRHAIPQTPQEIQNRINEISFNSSLLREMRAIRFVKRLLENGSLTRGSMKDVNVHMIADDTLMTDLSVATKILPNPVTLERLRKAGFEAADQFVSKHGDKIGREGSVDLAEMFDET